ncbi:ComEA family DNA-binding protein [Aquiflexum lacus]|uniref:ComEA family DNA-binding protein n=1 Tax=Aquiflexum lacus TaxID=2483805 RepID=UPI0018947D08|nr:helix-hairpin-helix domain-containing protein [Aquiflexum lacus]
MKTKFLFFLRSYFGFSQRESRGLLLVFPAIFLLYLIPSVYNQFLHHQNKERYERYIQKADSLIQAGWKPYESFSFISEMKSGQDTVRRAGQYQRVRSPQFNKLDFYEADSVVLQIVPGIGQTMAARVVKFRENIGGLHDKEQLLDVYGMTPEVMENIFEYFDFEPGIKNKLKINQLDAASLAKHPYLTYGASKVIVAYREQHGPYSQAEDLLKIKIFNEEWLERLKPYLEF